MQKLVLDFFSYYTKKFQELDTKALSEMYYIPSIFVFNITSHQVKEITNLDDLQHYLKDELTEQLSIERARINSMEITRMHSISDSMLLVEADWVHYHDGTSEALVIKCLFLLSYNKEQLKIVSTTFV